MKVEDGCVDVPAVYDRMRTGRLATGDLLATTAMPSPGQNFAEKSGGHVTIAGISPL